MVRTNGKEEMNGQQKLMRALRGRPLSHGDLVKETGLAPSTVSYHLKQLTKKGVLKCTEEKLYRIADEEEVELAIMNLLRGRRLTQDEIVRSQELTVFSGVILEAFERLLLKGLIEKVLTVNQPERYRLSWRGCQKLGICYVCNKPSRDGSEIGSHVLEELVGLWIESSGFIHPECASEILRENLDYGDVEYGKECFCDYCGLPLSPGTLRNVIERVEVKDLSLYLVESEMIAYNAWKEVWRKQQCFPPIVDVYRFIDTFSELVMLFEHIKEGVNLTSPETAEDYHPSARAKELFPIWQEIRRDKKRLADRVIELLIGPQGLVYEKLQPIGASSAYVLVKPGEKAESEKLEAWPVEVEGGDHSLVIREGKKRYHPYCEALIKKRSESQKFQTLTQEVNKNGNTNV